jgi:predicted RNA-binding Zn ribbon-like protein
MTDPTTHPTVLLLLANLGRPRRPSGVAAAYTEPILPDATSASTQLAPVVDQRVAEADLAGLRRLQRAAVHAAEAMLAGEAPDCAELNTLAAGSSARIELVVTDRTPRRKLTWTDTSTTAALARRLIDEVNAIEPDRLRQCARPACDLLFYDTTRSRTRRWHAEDPCGWRERQRVHRLSTSSSSRPDHRPASKTASEAAEPSDANSQMSLESARGAKTRPLAGRWRIADLDTPN